MKADCIIVLANEMDKEGNLNSESQGRIELGCKTFFENPTATMITCGWNYRPDSDLFIGQVLKDYAIKKGVPADQIIAELNSRDTVGDAFFTRMLVSKTDWKNLIVVTSDYHVDRTAAIFKFFYGPEFNINVIGSVCSDSPEKRAAEQRSLEAFNRTFEQMEGIEIVHFYERLSTQHPFYNGQVHPKLTIQL